MKQRQHFHLNYSERYAFTLHSTFEKRNEKTNETNADFFGKLQAKENITNFKRTYRPGAMLATKNHQGGLEDRADESDKKCLKPLIFFVAQLKR